MTKTLKGLQGRTFSTSTTEEFINARNIFVTQPADQLTDGAVIGNMRSLAPTERNPAGAETLDSGFAVKPNAPLMICPMEFGAHKSADMHVSLHAFDHGTNQVPPTLADEGPLTITPGGSVTALIDATGDTDEITIELVAGQTYVISMRGTGGDPLSDSFLEIYDPNDDLVDDNDDGGNGTYSLLTITAAVSGTYTIVTSSFSNPGDPGTGEYTIDVREQGADENDGTFGDADTISVGATFGFLEAGIDSDMYVINLTEGQLYTFSLAAGADYESDWQNLPAGQVDTFITLYDSNGNVVASGDDVAFPDDISSAIGFLAEESGTYYLEVTVSPFAANAAAQTGGYVLDVATIELGDFDPLDAINWFSADNVEFVDVAGVPTAYVYFGAAGENFGELGDDGVSPAESFGWNATEMAAVMSALEQYEHLLGVNYEITTDVNQATFRLFTTTSTQFGAYFYPQDPAFGTQQGIGAFNVDSGAWSVAGQPGLQQGGYDFAVILHEFGHAHGLAHPHDNGGGSDVLLGVTASTGSYGIFNLNQGVYTVMSYNDAWDFHPDGPTPFTIAHADSGWSGTLSAFDIAVLQLRYGVHEYNETDTVYTITDVDDDAFYSTIWDSGGTDEIAYAGIRDAVIDLTAATLDYSATGGGVISFVRGIFGGYTIANGVVIENATGGSGNDMLVGNDAANELTGNGGSDILIGREGDDTLDGGGGNDTVIFAGNVADYTVTNNMDGTYTVTDNNAADGDEGTDLVIDAEYLQFADDVITDDPDPMNNDVPSLSGLTNALVFNESTVNAGPQLIDGDVDFQDDDINGGTLTISGLLAEDVVAIRDQGNGVGQIGVDGSDITYNGIVIGSFTGGNGTSLTVTFTTAVTAPAVDALIQNLTYANASQDPTTNRVLTISLVDDQGAAMTVLGGTVRQFVELTGGSDPLSGLPAFGAGPNLAFVDVNNDGDLDIVVGDQNGTLRYFEDNGPGYTEVTGGANPFSTFVGETQGGATGSLYTAPCTIDIDGDGDLDLVVGNNYGYFATVRNNGNGTWTQLTAGANPLDGIVDVYFSDPTAIDYDGDGDMDLVAGSSYGDLYAIRNDGGGNFTFVTGVGRPFGGAAFDVGSFSSAASGDVDADGDLDLVVGEADGTINTFINNGGGVFTLAVGAANPFNGIDVGSYSIPTLADIDGDGDADLVVADNAGGDTRVFQNSLVALPGSPNISITVNAQNDAPSGTDHTVELTESAAPTAYVFTLADFGFSDVDGDAFSAVVINTIPLQGALRLNGVAVTANQVITAANISGGLLTFTPDANESGPNYATFTFSVRDDGGTANGGVNTDPTPNVMSIEVAPVNSPPRLTDVVDEVTYNENVVNATPQILDLDVTFSDPDDNLNGGTVTVSGLVADDLVGINNEGNGAGQIGVSGNTISYGGVAIGTFSGGAGATLTVTLNGNADSESVEALIENLTYANTSDEPTATRTLTINVTDAAGADLAFQTSFEFAGTGDDNPFDGLSNGGSYSTPTFLDVDSDGDLDMLSGGNTGAIFYYRNDGGTFAEVPGSQNPFNGIDVGAFSVTAAVNIDTDGDLDLVVGRSDGTLVAFRNNGNGTFTSVAVTGFTGLDVGGFSTPTGGDIDGDGDMDVVIGTDAGTFVTLRNNGNGTFTNLTGAANPFQNVDAGSYSTISLFDLDGDGDLDALLGNSAGSILAFNNGGVFTPADPEQNPFSGLTIGYGATFGFADLDGDGDLDAVGGSNYGDFLTFENTTEDSSIVVNVVSQVDRVELYDQDDNLVATYNDIQDAVDAALDGYRIVAPAGTYDEDLVIDVDVTIEGANAGTSGSDARGAETIINGSVVITADGVTIDGVTVTGDAPDAGFFIGVNVQGNDFSLVNSVLSGRDGDFADDTVAVFGGAVTGLDIGDNLITGYLRGVYLFSGSGEGSVHDNLFQGAGSANWFEGMGNGIVSNTSLVIISNNTFDGIWAGVLNVGPFGPGSTIDLETFIFGNVFTGNNGARPIQVYPTMDTPNLIGTDENEAFNGDIAGLVSGTAVSFDGQGGDDHIYGFDGGDTLSGGTGSDQVFAQGGNDTMSGGAGNDFLDGDAGTDTALFADANLAYTDTVIGWLINSSEGNDFVQDTEIVVDGSGQRNLLVGSSGYASLQDALTAAQDGDNLRLSQTAAYTGTVNYTAADLTVIAQPGALLNVTFATTSGNGITVLGAAGVGDNITTGEGNDFINGGLGADVMTGGDGDDFYVADNANDVVHEVAGEGDDRVLASLSYALAAGQSIETLTTDNDAGTAAINLTGNEIGNSIFGNEGNNLLSGADGIDQLVGYGGNDTLIGGTGGDALYGGLGNDIYQVDNADDLIFENAGEGDDTVVALGGYTLGAGVSVETLSAANKNGTDAMNLFGNELGQSINGNEGANVLNGMGGNDLLRGYGGADIFLFNSALGAGNVDVLADFVSGTDRIFLDNDVFTGLGGGNLDAGAFVVGSAAADANDRIIYNSATGQLYFDADGNGAGAAVLFATLNGNPVLTASDFQII